MQPSIIFLYGPPGSGKTTSGKILAGKLSLPFYDLDEQIQERSGHPIAEIFSRQGETAFRELEHQAIEHLSGGWTGVVALGGGSLLATATRKLVEAIGTVVCLETSPDEILRRLQSSNSPGDNQPVRPLLQGDTPARLVELLEKRAEHYASFSKRINTTSLDAAQTAWKLQILLGRFLVGLGSSTQEILLQPAGLDALGQLLLEHNFHSPVEVVSDGNVAPLYADQVLASLASNGLASHLAVIPAGEASKTIDSVQDLWKRFLESGLERSSLVISLGGGVVGDLAGFAAATYLRGISWVNLPTSLLAMVDASLGGKTAVDTVHGKNLVGAFHPASLVLVDVKLLGTLPEVELRSGLAEMVKHAIIGDAELLGMTVDYYRNYQKTSPVPGQVSWDNQAASELISRAMAVKIGIIEQDPFEKGLRASLNLGHTVGHALEVASNYQLRHGEAIAIGLVVEARLAERLGLADDGLSRLIASNLEAAGLPVRIPGYLDPAEIRQAIQFDKKKAHGRVRFTLPERIGSVLVGVDVPDDILESEI